MLEGSVFKRLPRNDTGQAAGHQAGIVIPRAISEFFPEITDLPTAENPTPGIRVWVDMFVDGDWVGRANSSFHLETWGATRLPGEIRLTDELGPLRNLAEAGDLAVFVFDTDDEREFSLHLFRQGSETFPLIDKMTSGRRWGLLDAGFPPISVTKVSQARREVRDISGQEFSLFSDERPVFESLVTKRVRAKGFRIEVLTAYGFRCAFTGSTLVTVSGLHGLDAAHIVPVEHRGADHIGNGLALSKDFHWAFDKGLLGVNQDRRVVVSPLAAEIPENAKLREIDGAILREPAVERHRANATALDWHFQNVFAR